MNRPHEAAWTLVDLGFAIVHALPMRQHAEVIGALNLVDSRPGALSADRFRIGQAMSP